MMEETTRLTQSGHRSLHRRGARPEFGDDECSTDSGCSSGGSTGSADGLSRRGSGERLCSGGRSPRGHCYLDRPRGRPTTTRSQERLSRTPRSDERVRAKSSRSWSPEDARALPRESPSHSPSASDAHSTDSDSLKRPSTTESLRRAFRNLKFSSRWENKEAKHAKKSPKRILRTPVSYTYVRGLSGLPTQRVPRNAAQQLMIPNSCQDTIGLYR
ncbi:uncharacterized protein LOC107265631 [Cephus cinctus]|uniref:Uncharacterized protein LOC107265631 n=1 Tax=Cephus cinctus TaxID=211228 RepID=A0AAJ7BQ02_CEPCN|nr:uncharacterized protein LOC107265631 [Cephus cinctus]